MKWKNKECNNYNCADRKELIGKQDEYDKLSEDYEALKTKFEDFNKIVETGKLSDEKSKEIIAENARLTQEVTAFRVESNRLKVSIRQRNYEIDKLKEQITEINEREVRDVYAYRNLEERKKTLSKEVETLADRKNKISIDNKVIKQFYNETLPKAKELRDEIELLEKEKKEIIKKLKKYNKLDKGKIKLSSLRARLFLNIDIKRIRWLIKKGKKEKAQMRLKKTRAKINQAVLPIQDKKLLILTLRDEEVKIR